jgi:DNA-binding NarL/FixJ family response regulator/DNA invertase Pin-like site-specific DNA recombinase
MQTDQCLRRFEAVYGNIPHNLRVFKDLGKSGAIGLDNPAFGGKEHREGLEALLNAMADGELDLVLCYSQDRLARDEFLWHYMNAQIFQKHRIPILFARDGHDVLTEEGQMIGTLHALAASLERRKASRNVAASCQRRATEGYLTGPPPYGWEYDPSQTLGPRVRRRIVRNEAEGAVLLETRDRYLAGWPTAAIARDLHRRGIVSPSGALRWSTDGILKVITNPVNAGLVRCKDQLFPGHHAEIRYWSPEERELILQRVAQRRDRPLHARRVDDYLVSGLLFCEHCGRRLVGHRENRRGTRHYSCHESRTGGQHRQREKREFVGLRSCPGFTRPADEVEEAIIQAVRDLAHSPAVQQMAQDRLQAAMDEKDTRLHDELAGVTKEVGRVQQGFTRLFAMLDDGKIKPEEFEAENNRRRGEQEALERRRLQLEAELAQRRGRLAQLTAALELLRDFDRLWAKMTAGERRELLRRIDPHMTMRRDSDALVLTIRPGWTQPLEIGFALNPRQVQWTPGQDAPLTPAQLSLLCSWQEGMSLHEIARARDISHTQVIATAREACRRLDVPDLDAAVELVPERLERCRATIKTKGRFNKRPSTDPNLLSEPLLAILRLMAEGKRCVQIAADLGKNKSTISRQMLQINRRLAVRSQNEAVERARELGLI